MRKLIYLIIALVVLILSVSLGNTAAQEPTEEAPPVVVVEENQEAPVTVPEGGVVVVPTDNASGNNFTTTLAMIISGIVALASIASQYLSGKDLRKLLTYGEGGESILWQLARGSTEIVKAAGGDPNVVISNNPTEIAVAIRSGDKPILILEGTSGAAIVEALNKTSPAA